MRLIDAHIHIFDQIKGFGFQGECHPIGGGRVEFDTGLQNQRFPAFLGDTNVTAEKMLEEVMDKNGVEKAVLLQCPSNGLQNQYYHQVWQKYPDRFLPACMIDPEVLRFDEILEHMIRDFHYRVFKLEMSMIAGLTGAHVRTCSTRPIWKSCLLLLRQSAAPLHSISVVRKKPATIPNQSVRSRCAIRIYTSSCAICLSRTGMTMKDCKKTWN